MDRLPKNPPFAIGTRLRYVGTHESYTFHIDAKTQERTKVALCVPGMIVTVDKVVPGRRGTLRHLTDFDGPMYDDCGEPVLDNTQDGYSVYHVEAFQNGVKQGRCIFPDGSKDWQRVR